MTTISLKRLLQSGHDKPLEAVEVCARLLLKASDIFRGAREASLEAVGA